MRATCLILAALFSVGAGCHGGHWRLGGRHGSGEYNHYCQDGGGDRQASGSRPDGAGSQPVNSIPLANYNHVEGYNTISTSKSTEFNNKNLILNLFQDVFIPKKLDNVEKYIDTVTYFNHNPEAPDGLSAFKVGFTATNGFYAGKPEIRQIGADGDLVWIQVKDNTNACIDIWRIRNGKIIEHWDVSQTLEPASSTSANSHPFF